MGTDIHVYMEAKAQNGFWYAIANCQSADKIFEIYRRYALFNELANGVRGETITGFQIKGLPSDLSPILKQLLVTELDDYSVYHSHSWLSLNEFKIAVDNFEKNYQVDFKNTSNFEIPTGETPVDSIVISNKYTITSDGTNYWSGFNYMPFPETLDQFTGGFTGENVRIVFMFDN